nr:hypothetical protein [Tanacetum cinerariifolium]
MTDKLSVMLGDGLLQGVDDLGVQYLLVMAINVGFRVVLLDICHYSGCIIDASKTKQRVREESERLRLHEREQIRQNRKRDLILSARVAAKVEGKKLELQFLWWSKHHNKLGTFLRSGHPLLIIAVEKYHLEKRFYWILRTRQSTTIEVPSNSEKKNPS